MVSLGEAWTLFKNSTWKDTRKHLAMVKISADIRYVVRIDVGGPIFVLELN